MKNELESGDDLTTVATFSEVPEASMARGALEAAGIPAVVPLENLGTFTRFAPPPTTRVELKVRQTDRVRALALLGNAGHR